MGLAMKVTTDAVQILGGYGYTREYPVEKWTGRHLNAAEAMKLGIVEEVYPAEELLAEARKLAAELANGAPVALALDTDLDTGCKIESHYFGLIAGTEDAKEGTGAFLEKRKPQFKGQ